MLPPLEPQLELVEVEGLLAGASNATLLAQDADGTRWVYKPEQGERPLWDFPPRSLARREVACYRLSAVLELESVPETVVADGPYGPGSAQRFLDEDWEWDPRPLIVSADPVLWPIALLDLVANNADRKIGHLLREPGRDKIWAIDNGLTFHPEEKLRTVLWSFAGQPIPGDLMAAVQPASIAEALSAVLAAEDVEAAVGRAELLVDDPRHPGPPVDRPPMPWPLW